MYQNLKEKLPEIPEVCREIKIVSENSMDRSHQLIKYAYFV